MMQTRRADELKRKRPVDRVTNACKRCRKQKIKCSGTNPCKTCHHRGSTCEFDFDERKVLVTERYLNDLKARLQHLEEVNSRSNQDPPVSADAIDQAVLDTDSQDDHVADTEDGVHDGTAFDEPGHDASHSPAGAAPNPLVSEQPAYVLNTSGKLLYLGHSSTWAFGLQVLQMTRQHFQTPSPFLNGEAEAYELDRSDHSPVDLSGLPSLEMSMLLLSTVKYRLHPFFYLFDEKEFVDHLHRLYKNPAEYAQAERLHFVHYLVIMALGKSLSSNAGAGLSLFNRALSLLPDVTQLSRDPTLPIEIMCSIAMYLECIDYRCASFTMIGQAVRLAQIHGLHTDHQIGDIGEYQIQRFRRLWWTLYSIDRRFSAIIGLAHSLHDQDITSPLPDLSSFEEPFVISVKLSQQIGKVVNTIYGVNGRLNRGLLPTAQSVIRGIAGLSDEITAFSDSCFGDISRTAAHLSLAYHQCIILTTRPFLFYLLQRRLDTDPLTTAFPLSASTKGLVQICIESAIQIVTTLSQLRQHDLLDTFLPFDLDGVFSAAFVLLMAHGIHPKLLPATPWLHSVYQTLDYMTHKGNLLAHTRKSEIEELRQTLQQGNNGAVVSKLNNQSANATATMTTAVEADVDVDNDPIDTASLPSLGDPFFDVWNANDGSGAGFSGTQLLSLADELGNEDWNDIWLEHCD